MTLYYFDTSTLVKYYVTEPGSTWITGLIDASTPETGLPMHTIFVAAASIAEVSAALSVLQRRGVISHRHRDDAYSHFIADVEDRFVIAPVTLQDFYSIAGTKPSWSLPRLKD
jgi:predicted nucleic acid-binding protein